MNRLRQRFALVPGRLWRRFNFWFRPILGTILLFGGISTPAATFTVTNVNDGGLGSFRQAIINANASGGTNTIVFNLAGSEPFTLSPASAYPILSNAVSIDATTLTNFSGTPLVQLNGTNAGTNAVGLYLTGGNSVLRGLVINSFAVAGVVLEAGGTNVVEGNFIGTDSSGTNSQPNGVGIRVLSTANRIGGTNAAQRNIVSGNSGSGLFLSGAAASNNVVQGNFCGTRVTGLVALANGTYGIEIVDAPGNSIGGLAPNSGNVMSGNSASGLRVAGAAASNNVVQGNFIGTGVGGATGLANTARGITIEAAPYTTIGGATNAARNVISGNGSVGINILGSEASHTVIQGNYIGVDITGTNSLPNTSQGIRVQAGSNHLIGGTNNGAGNRIANNTSGVNVSAGNCAILGNSMFSNGVRSINLGGPINDALDVDSGPNNLQNYPVVTSATNNTIGTPITGTLHSTPSQSFRVEFFASPASIGDGKNYLGAITVTTDGSGNASFSCAFVTGDLTNQFITATATDPSGNTSEFSTSQSVTFNGRPIITGQPEDQTSFVNGTANFTVTASGAPSPGYQWLLNGAVMPGETNSVLELFNLQLAQAGNYSVIVSNVAGAVVSQTALLKVPSLAPADLIGWWPGDSNALDYASSHHGTLVNGTGFADGKVQGAFDFDGTDDYVDIAELPELQNATEITVMAWVNKRNTSNIYAGFVGRWDSYPLTKNNTFLLYNGDGAAAHKGAFALCFNDSTGGVLSGLSLLPTNEWIHLAASWRSSDGYTALYKNGVLEKATVLGVGKALKYLPGYTVKIGEWGVVRDASFKLDGQIDEAALFNRSLSAGEVQMIYAAGSAGMDKRPYITSQPVGQAALTGASVAFTVNANGQQPLSYQWQFNGTNLAGATNATLLLNNLQLADAGTYTVEVSNPNGATLSEPAGLSVTDPTLIGLLHWWTGDSNAFDYAGTNHGTLVNGATYGPGRVGPAFNLDGVNDYVELGETPDLLGAMEFTVMAWINKRDESNLYSGFVGRWDSFPSTRNNTFLLYNGDGTASHKGALVLNFSDDSAALLKGNALLPTNQWVHLAATWRSSDGYTALYKNGVLETAATMGAGKNLKYLPGYGAKIGEWGVVRTAAYKFSGQINEVAIFNRALSAQEVQTAAATGTPALIEAPVITVQPLDQSVPWDGSVLFSPQAIGAPPLHYQWLRDGQPIVGATNLELVINSIQFYYAGEYALVVSNAYGSIVSLPASLFVEPPTVPVITAHPQSMMLLPGTNVILSVGYTGNGPTYFQWQLNGVNIPGATNSTLVLNNLQATNSGSYSVAVYTDAGAVTSDPALLSVSAPALPLSDTFEGQSILNSAAGGGQGSNVLASIQSGEPRHAGKPEGASVWIAWQAPANGVATFATVGSSFDTLLAVYTGNTLTNLTEMASDEDDGGYLNSRVKFNASAGVIYRIAVAGFAGAKGRVVLNWGLEATAETLPVILTQPIRKTVAEGVPVAFNVAASPGDVTYQWYLNGVAVPGAVGTTFNVAGAGKPHVGTYKLRVNRGTRFVDSAPAILQVNTEGSTQAAARSKLADSAESALLQPIELASPERPGVISLASPGPARGYSGSQIFSTQAAAKQPGEPNHCGLVGGASSWFVYQAPASGPLEVDTDGSTFDTVLAVYTGPGTDFQSLSLVACDNNSGADGLDSRVSFNATSNTVYYIAVDGVNGASGTVVLNYQLSLAPAISSQPQSRTVPLGGSVTLLLVASGVPPPVYQWTFNGAPIPGATNASLTMTNFQAEYAARYQVWASNTMGLALSAPADLFVDGPLRMTDYARQTNGLMSLRVIGPTNATCIIEASTNLANWLPLATNTAPTGLWDFVDFAATNYPARYYRVLSGP